MRTAEGKIMATSGPITGVLRGPLRACGAPRLLLSASSFGKQLAGGVQPPRPKSQLALGALAALADHLDTPDPCRDDMPATLPTPQIQATSPSRPPHRPMGAFDAGHLNDTAPWMDRGASGCGKGGGSGDPGAHSSTMDGHRVGGRWRRVVVYRNGVLQ